MKNSKELKKLVELILEENVNISFYGDIREIMDKQMIRRGNKYILMI